MWLDEADGFAEIFKGYLPFYLFVALPIFIIMSPVNPVAASHEFSVYRMQQYDLHTVPHGCRSASFNLEGRSLTSWSTSRHCVVARVQDITLEQFLEIRNKAGALLLVLPKNETLLTPEEREHIQLLEMAMVQQEINAPVYFARWTPEMEDILADLQHSFITDDKSGTALEAMFNTVSSNGYQIVVSAPTPQKLDSKPVTLHGKLIGRSGSAQTIVIAANYDSAALVPEISQGADCNASGAVALLELARIFSRIYSTAGGRGAPTLVFVLTSVGHSLNYFATKKWLEEQLDSSDASLLQDVSFVSCMECVSRGPVRMHVSRPPRAPSPAHSFRARLGAPLQHKKINLADELLAWHHERFSIRRMTAFTLSSLQSHKDSGRSTVLDTPSEDRIQNLVSNVARIARALASHIYNITDDENDEDAGLYDDVLNVDEAAIRYWYNYLSSQSRSAHIVTTSPNGGVTGALERVLSRYMEVTVSTHAVDKREPEYTLYSPTSATLYVYSVKPAVFDLILTLAIVCYLAVVYFAIQAFPRFYEEYAKIVTGKTKVQ
ncbi:BOS complex subunit NCLN [Bombyx mori]|uniref:BOS complex subunit NCLN n=1 Tax=Bombyx mori TaxID=7091 RepID=A0A8R1WPS8_BOMMO|nr:nicalin [Bombyx mori]